MGCKGRKVMEKVDKVISKKNKNNPTDLGDTELTVGHGGHPGELYG